jgi:hypothetical protein
VSKFPIIIKKKLFPKVLSIRKKQEIQNSKHQKVNSKKIIKKEDRPLVVQFAAKNGYNFSESAILVEKFANAGFKLF